MHEYELSFVNKWTSALKEVVVIANDEREARGMAADHSPGKDWTLLSVRRIGTLS